MSVKTLGSLVQPVPLNKLAPNLTYISDRALTSLAYQQIATQDFTGSLKTVLSLTGKWHIHRWDISSITANNLDEYKLTIDGVVVHHKDGFGSHTTVIQPHGALDGDWGSTGIICQSSFLLQMELASDTSVSFNWRAEPIL